ncbi:Phthiocerol/phthiodiolone dimycocerosyl transferase [Mycobacteroides abscessus subsp. massiliense]|nr:Phthiocerol/phthiodiolone dimycocerosyl transferase [Mycobacteroides abscessus subsp. massiliense]
MTDTRPYQDPADAPGTLIRSLSRLEAYFTFGYGHFGGHSMLISGELDIQALNDTFIEIQLRHESLRSVIHKDGQIPQFVVGHQPPRPIRIFEGEDLYTRPTGRQAAFDQTQQLVYVDLLTGEDHARVTFFCTMPLRTAATARRSSTNSGICMFSASRKGGSRRPAPKDSRNPASTS